MANSYKLADGVTLTLHEMKTTLEVSTQGGGQEFITLDTLALFKLLRNADVDNHLEGTLKVQAAKMETDLAAIHNLLD